MGADFDLASDNLRDLSVTSPPAQQAATELPPTPRRPATPLQPATPSWLDPPWPRQEVPFQSWSRPGTASTVCDEAELAQAPKLKFVDGQCIPMRVASSSKRLPPINIASPASARKLL